jgi:hypothetical protein
MEYQGTLTRSGSQTVTHDTGQISIIDPGFINTTFMNEARAQLIPLAPTYQGHEDLPAVKSRKALVQSLDQAEKVMINPEKVVQAVYAISLEQEPPVHVILGEEALALVGAGTEQMENAIQVGKRWTSQYLSRAAAKL